MCIRDRFFTITLPNIKGPLISVIFSVFTMIFTDYGVPLVVGGKSITLPVYMYREVIGLLDFSKGAIIGILLLIPAVIAFVLDLKNENKSSSSTVTRSYQIAPNAKRDRIAYIVCIATVVFLSLPLITFAVLSFVRHYPTDLSLTLDNITQAMDLGVRMYLKNSLAIAMLTSMIGVCLTYLTAFMTARNASQLSSRVLHLVSMISLAIPGVVLGLSYVLFYKGSFLYGGIAILVLVNITHFFANPYLMAYNSLQQDVYKRQLFDGDAQKVYQFLKKNYAITLTPSGGAMRERMLRVGHLGNLKLCDYDALCDGLREYGK